MPVLQEARFHIGQALQLLDVALDLGHGRRSERARGRVVVELRFSGFTGRFGLATVDGIEPLFDCIGQERHLPQVNIGLIGLLDDRIAFFQCGLECGLVLFGKRVQPLATSEEGAEQLDVGPDRLEAAHDRLGHLDHTTQGIDHDGNAVGRVLRPGLERAIVAQLDHGIGRVVGAQHHGFELDDQLFKGWERRRHDGLGHKVVLSPHTAQCLGGFFGRFDLGLGEPDVQVLVGSQILEEGQQACARLTEQFERNGRLARAVLEVRELEGNVVHDLGRIAQVATRILGLDTQKLQGLRGPFGLVIDSCQPLGELGQAHPDLLHGHTRNGGHRCKS